MEINQDRLERLRQVLGGDQVIATPINNEFDLIELTRKGIKRATVNHLSSYLDMTIPEIATLLKVSNRTLQRKKDDDLLGVYTSEQAIEVAEVIAIGEAVFHDVGRFKQWLHHPNMALGNKKPVDLMDTSFGTKLLLDELTRIEHGIFA